MNAALVTDRIPKPNSQSVEWNLAKNFDLPVFTITQGDTTSHDIQVNQIDSQAPTFLKRFYGSFLERLEYAFWKPPVQYDTIITSGLRTQTLAHWPDQRRIHYFHGIHRGSFGYPIRDNFSDNSVVQVAQKINRLLLRQWNSSSFNLIDKVVANSQFISEMISQHYATEADAIINPTFIRMNRYVDNHPDDEEFYLFLGRLSEEKGLRNIVEAFNENGKKLIIAGDGPMKSELESLSNDNVQILGYVSDEKKYDLFSRSSGFIQNTIAEPFGRTTIEALASGTPVIGVNAGNNPYLIEDEKNGILFDRQGEARNYRRPVSTEPLKNALKRAKSISWDHGLIRTTAQKYTEADILEQWEELLISIDK